MNDPKENVVKFDAKLIAQFWTAAADVFMAVVKAQNPQLRQFIDDKVSSGWDIEITAHNQAGRITVTLVDPTGHRQILFDDMVSLADEGEQPT
jgi:hypothetical protein